MYLQPHLVFTADDRFTEMIATRKYAVVVSSLRTKLSYAVSRLPKLQKSDGWGDAVEVLPELLWDAVIEDASSVRPESMIVSMHYTYIGKCHRLSSTLRMTCRTLMMSYENSTTWMTSRVTYRTTSRARSWTTPTSRMMYNCPPMSSPSSSSPPLPSSLRGLHEDLWVWVVVLRSAGSLMTYLTRRRRLGLLH